MNDEQQLQDGSVGRARRFVGDGVALRNAVLALIGLLIVAIVALATPPLLSLARQLPSLDRFWREPPTGASGTRPVSAVGPPVVSPIMPAGTPQSWVTNDDYPTESMRLGEQGVVGFTLEVGADGRVHGCRITQSSGHRLLDRSACDLLRRRARFHPARDSSGKPISATWSSRFRWMLPD